MVDGDANEWPANLKRSQAAVERFKGRYVVVPKRNTKAGRASLRARFCPDLRAIGFVAPGDGPAVPLLLLAAKSGRQGTPRPLDLFTLQERRSLTQAQGGFLEGLARKRQAAARRSRPAAPAAPPPPRPPPPPRRRRERG